MDLSKISDKAKQLLEQRGGTDAVKQDLDELKEIARGEGSLADKAKAALEALKDPGARGEDVAGAPEGTRAPEAPSTPEGPATPDAPVTPDPPRNPPTP